MKKIMSIILVVMMLVGIGVTANAAVYNEEENSVNYTLVVCLTMLGMTPDPNLEMGEEGMIWTRQCTLTELEETAVRLGGDLDFSGEGDVYMWYDVSENIGTFTIVGEFTYYWADDEEQIFHFWQETVSVDDEGDLVPMTEWEEIYW